MKDTAKTKSMPRSGGTPPAECGSYTLEQLTKDPDLKYGQPGSKKAVEPKKSATKTA